MWQELLQMHAKLMKHFVCFRSIIDIQDTMFK